MTDIDQLFEQGLMSLPKSQLRILAQVIAPSPESEKDPEKLERARVWNTIQEVVHEVTVRSPTCDHKLARRFMSGRYTEYVQSIRKAIDDGVFVINIVAPEYRENKDLIDLVLDSALLYGSENVEVVEGQEGIAQTRDAYWERYAKMRSNIVREVDVDSLFTSQDRPDNEVLGEIKQVTHDMFFGRAFFSPYNEMSLMTPYVRDYRRSTEPQIQQVPGQPPIEGPSERDENRMTRGPEAYAFYDPIEGQTNPEDLSIDKSRHNLRLAKPMSLKKGNIPSVLYFDERPLPHLRRNPSSTKAYMYPFSFNEHARMEIRAATRYQEMIASNMTVAPTFLQKKWMLFSRLLGAVQGNTSTISVFHPHGFDSGAEGRGAFRSPGADVDLSVFEAIDASDDEVEAAFETLLREFEARGESEEEESTPAAVSPAGPVRRERVYTPEQIARMEPAERISTLANLLWQSPLLEAVRSNAGDHLTRMRLVPRPQQITSWLRDNGYDQYIAAWGNVATQLYQALRTIARNAGASASDQSAIHASISSIHAFIKEAAVPRIMHSRGFQELRDLIERTKELGIVSDSVAADYVVTKLTQMLVDKMKSGKAEFDFESARNETVPITTTVQPGRNGQSVTVSLEELVGRMSGYDFQNLNALAIDSLEAVLKEKEFYLFNEEGEHEPIQIRNVRILSGAGRNLMGRTTVTPNELSDAHVVFSIGNSGRIQNIYDRGSSGLYMKPPKEGVAGTVDDLYSYLYEEDAEKARRLHQSNDVELHLSILPPWAPMPFDYRFNSERGVGNGNNAKSVSVVSDALRTTRSELLRRAKADTSRASTYEQILHHLEDEMGEAANLLHGWAVDHYDRLYGRDKSVRDAGDSLMRDVSKDASSFYQEVRAECARRGVNIGQYNPEMSRQIVEQVLPANQREVFNSVWDELSTKRANRHTFSIIRGADSQLTNRRDNGFLVKQERGDVTAGQRGMRLFWSDNFKAQVENLYNRVAGQASTTGTGAGRQRSHIILITDEPVPSFFAVPEQAKETDDQKAQRNKFIRHIAIHANLISQEEIEQIIDFHCQRLKEDYRRGHGEEMRASPEARNYLASFSVPASFVSFLQTGLSDLPFREIEPYIAEKVQLFFVQYMEGQDVIEIFDREKTQMQKEVDAQRVSNTHYASMGIACKVPRYRLVDYVVRSNTSWNARVFGKRSGGGGQGGKQSLNALVESIKDSETRVDLYRRCRDRQVGFGQCMIAPYQIRNVEGESVGEFQQVSGVYVEWPGLVTSESLYWFPLPNDSNKRAVMPTPRDGQLVELVDLCGYRVVNGIYEAIQSGEGEFGQYAEQITGDVYDRLQQAVGGISGEEIDSFPVLLMDNESVSQYGSVLDQTTAELVTQIQTTRRSFDTIILLYGAPGTGKSIFAEVLANVLNCKYLETNMTNIFYTGATNYRGVAENNLERFLGLLRNLKDTVVLIDEFDKIFQGPDTSESGDKNKILDKLQLAWGESNDTAIYAEHNVHLVLTTNYLDTLRREANALLNRIQNQYEVVLPTDEDTLNTFFTTDAVIDNLMTNKFGSDLAVAEAAKHLVRIYDDPEVPDMVKESFVRRIKESNPRFFQEFWLLSPGRAHNEWRQARGLTVKDSVDEVADFVAGWKMARTLFARINNQQTVGVRRPDGTVTPETIQPLRLICRELAAKSVYPRAEPAPEGSPEAAKYPRLSMRDILHLAENMLSMHQRYMAGDDTLPLNYKTMLATVYGSTWIHPLKRQDMEEEAQNDQVLLQAMQEKGEDGQGAILSTIQLVGGEREVSPTHYYTRENLEESMRKEQEAMAVRRGEIGHVPQKEGDEALPWGARYLIESVRTTLELTDPDTFGEKLQQLLEYLPTGMSADEPLIKSLRSYLSRFQYVREQLKIVIAQIDETAEAQQKQDLFQRVQHLCGNIRWLEGEIVRDGDFDRYVRSFQQATRDSQRGHVLPQSVLKLFEVIAGSAGGGKSKRGIIASLSTVFGQYLGISSQGDAEIDENALQEAIDARYSELQVQSAQRLRSAKFVKTFSPALVEELSESEYEEYWASVIKGAKELPPAEEMPSDQTPAMGLNAPLDRYLVPEDVTAPFGVQTIESPSDEDSGVPPSDDGVPILQESVVEEELEEQEELKDMEEQTPGGTSLFDADIDLSEEEQRQSTTGYYLGMLKKAGVFDKKVEAKMLPQLPPQPPQNTVPQTPQLEKGVDGVGPEDLRIVAQAALGREYSREKRFGSPIRTFQIGPISFVRVPELDLPDNL